MNRYPNFIDPTCSRFGEYEVVADIDWPVVFWSAVVVIGLAWCAAKFLGVV